MSDAATRAPGRGRIAGVALAGTLLLGTAGGLMAAGAPAHAVSGVSTLSSATFLQHLSVKAVRAELANARLAPGRSSTGSTRTA